VAVTVLTSLDKNDFSELGISRSMEDQVLQMANLAKECGLSGVVASPMEVEWLRKNLGPDFTIVVPGIRPAEAGLDDQKRIATPAEAITRGASYIVVGRPILKANDPVQAIEEILGS
jgi:orotidine-5'-phosphate decarboxylase